MSNGLVCRQVQSRRDRKAFLRLPLKIYRDDPMWVPPLWRVQEELVGFRKHPFYFDADRAALIALRHGEVVGRVLALVNHGHNRRYDEKRGFFGFFECIDDVEVARSLFRTAGQWLQSQGMTDFRGPTNPSLNYECGLLVDGFETPPTFMITHNPPYYENLVLQSGFSKVEDLYCYDVDISMLDDLDPKLAFVVEEVKRRFNVSCRPLDKRRFAEDVRTFLEIYNQSLQGTWGYVPMSEAEIDHQAKGLKMLIVPELTSIAEVDGEPVGAGFGLLDYNQIIKKIHGRLLPFGWIKLFTQRKSIKRVRLISTNVLPKYQKWGLGLVTLERILPDAIKYGIEEGELSWVLESNSLSRNTIERGGGRRIKTHRLYDASLDSLK